jgi:transcriptional regulator with XRE-family HTH domain
MARRPNIAVELSSDPDPLLVLVGSRVRAARQRAKLKQSELAGAIETAQSYIVSIEAGEANITLKTLARLGAALKVSPVSLLLETEPPASLGEGVVSQLSKMLSVALQDADHLTDFLQRAHALVTRKESEPGPDATP